MKSGWHDKLFSMFREHGVQNLPKPLWEFEPLEDYKSYCFDLAIVDLCRNFAVCVVGPSGELIHVLRYRLTAGSVLSADSENIMDKALKEMQGLAHRYITEQILVDRIILED